MNSLMFDMGLAVWFGILTSISPCPLATNITAISFIGKRVSRKSDVFLAGFLYMLGRMSAYTALGAALISSTRLIPPVANFLQTYMVYLLGPGLVLLGLFMLEVVTLNFGNGLLSERIQRRAAQMGLWGAALMGLVFALSFCPVSAGLFFGSLFSLALRHQSAFLFPSLYGVGTALPVLGFAFVLAFFAHLLGNVFQKLSAFERWARRITGIVCILAGLYLCLTQIFIVF